ncbi:hypothetical protein ACFZAR_32520 [Streptomyces sp. NPDC008222]|uniref:MmyB family transcriptional regulator n=1 Tax=Streptomyces sp. NPDC008222 TaxID=3364820 RepID=UPI0036E5CFD8
MVPARRAGLPQAGRPAGAAAGAGAGEHPSAHRRLDAPSGLRSERFRLLWSRHEVRPRRSRLTHPQVGDLELHSNKFEIGGTGGMTLVVFRPEPGSRSAESLALPGSLHAGSGDADGPLRTGPAEGDAGAAGERRTDRIAPRQGRRSGHRAADEG